MYGAVFLTKSKTESIINREKRIRFAYHPSCGTKKSDDSEDRRAASGLRNLVL